MKIELSAINPQVKVAITGDESWLASIYESFESDRDSAETPRLSGSLTIDKTSYGTFTTTGQLQFAPYVACGRCDQLLTWPLDLSFSLDCRQETKPTEIVRERDLKESELEIFYFSGDSIDLELILNEMIQIALPTQTIKRDDNGQCIVCHKDLRDDLAYGSRDTARENPFAALKKLQS